METLPWPVQLLVFRGIGRDALRSLGVRPGKVEVPRSLRDALERSLNMQKTATKVFIPIAQTTKFIMVNMSVPSWSRAEVHVAVYDSAPNSKFILSINGRDWNGIE